jgi:hypothetical protein
MNLRDAVEPDEFVFVVLGGGRGGEEDEVVPLCFEGGGVAARDYWKVRLDLSV